MEDRRHVAERACGVLCWISSFRDGPKDQTSDVQLHIGEPRDSGFARCAPRNDGYPCAASAFSASWMLLRFQLVSLSLICMSNDSANLLAAKTGSRWPDRV